MWDFIAELDQLVAFQGSAFQGSADAWRRSGELSAAASALVEKARTVDPEQLHTWLDENAELLIAQQLLVRSAGAARIVRFSQEVRLRPRGGPSRSRHVLAWFSV